MTKQNMIRALAAATLPLLSLVGAAAMAEGIGDSNRLVCATTEVVACTDSPGCVEGRAKHFEMPELMIIDLEQKQVHAHEQSGHEEVSEIKNSELSEDHLILQGVEQGRGWGISVNQSTGVMTTSVSGDGVSFILFGTCTAI